MTCAEAEALERAARMAMVGHDNAPYAVVEPEHDADLDASLDLAERKPAWTAGLYVLLPFAR